MNLVLHILLGYWMEFPILIFWNLTHQTNGRQYFYSLIQILKSTPQSEFTERVVSVMLSSILLTIWEKVPWIWLILPSLIWLLFILKSHLFFIYLFYQLSVQDSKSINTQYNYLFVRYLMEHVELCSSLYLFIFELNR